MSWSNETYLGVVEKNGEHAAVAITDIPAYTIVGAFEGKLVILDRKKDGSPDYGDLNTHMMLDMSFTPDRYLGMTIAGDSPVDFINHSCKPNCMLTGIHNLTMMTVRDIKEGELLTFDYRPVTLAPLGITCWGEDCGEHNRCQL